MKRELTVLCAAVGLFPALAGGRPPNVVIFLADDMGIGDAGCYGCRDIRTPHIDALARDGVRFTNYYCAAPICSPSRASLLTGRYPARAGMSTTKNVGSGEGDAGLPPTEITLAELAKTRGYAAGIVGKWHLGFTEDSVPNAQGFDFFFGFHASALDYFSHLYYLSEPYHHDLYRNRREVYEDGRHLTELFAREASAFIDAHKDRPFLLYVAFNAPHYPMIAQFRYLEMYKDLPKTRRLYAALVTGMDDAIGATMETLRRSGLARNTLVFFTSDNGAAGPSPREEGGGSNAPYRGHKKSLFDGGIRMPAVLSWPGVLPKGEARDQLAMAVDVFPTLAEIIGADLPKDRVLDGRSWLPWLKDAKGAGHDMLFFEWDAQHAVRKGKWKLVRNGLVGRQGNKQVRAEGEDTVFLSDMEADPGETTNLRRRHPEIADELLREFDAWQAATSRAEKQ